MHMTNDESCLSWQAKEQEDKFKKAKDDKSEWEIHIKQDDNGWTNGVRLGDGDGTVPLISLGLQCRKCAAVLLVQAGPGRASRCSGHVHALQGLEAAQAEPFRHPRPPTRVCASASPSPARHPVRLPCLSVRFRQANVCLTTLGLSMLDDSVRSSCRRGGPRSSDHVDVLGNVDVMEDVLRIAAGQVLDDNITSMIDTIAKRVTLPGDEPQKSWSIL